jgi:hypothetical protein
VGVALCAPDGTLLGMLVFTARTCVHRFELEHRPSVFALDCLGIAAVRTELRRHALLPAPSETRSLVTP